MTSPAKAHFQRHAAALGVEERIYDKAAANMYELMLAKLTEDRRRLKDVQSIERKIEVKRQLLPEYQPWITGVLEGATGQQDDVLMNVFVWAIDVEHYAVAIKIADYALQHKLVMPDQYQRDVATVLAEEVADQTLKNLAAEKPAASTNALLHIANLTADHDMPDEVRAKLYKAIGYAHRAEGSLPEAKNALARALELHDKCGVKKDIERLETAIKNSVVAPEGEG